MPLPSVAAYRQIHEDHARRGLWAIHRFHRDTVMSLTDTAIRKAKFEDKPYKLSDEKGLYLLINHAGKYWRLDYRFDGKRKTLALGVYPEISLKDARERRDEARKRLAQGIGRYGRTRLEAASTERRPC